MGSCAQSPAYMATICAAVRPNSCVQVWSGVRATISTMRRARSACEAAAAGSGMMPSRRIAASAPGCRTITRRGPVSPCSIRSQRTARSAIRREKGGSGHRAMDAYAMAATVDFGLDAKQGLLDLRSENARLRFVTRLFRAALKRLDFVDRAQARAKSNGKVRFG